MTTTLASPLRSFIKEQVEMGNVHSEQEAKAKILEALEELDANELKTADLERSKQDYPKTSEKRRDLSKWIGAAPGIFKTAQEVDDFIRKERDTWD
ncbi:hypothetical protein [Candidatus Thiosymbion oneisti]|uniref:hypothetical protein n=1 Tax=Candidatus Thiosymbion oneisti TaxID=589554 RepID=UPI000B7E36C2|nr:hypothetical protein [Candidatus Thiosymbion oneisti]